MSPVPLHEPLGFPGLAAVAPTGTQPGALPVASLGSGAGCCLGADRSGINFPQKQDTVGEPAGLLPHPGKRSRGWGGTVWPLALTPVARCFGAEWILGWGEPLWLGFVNLPLVCSQWVQSAGSCVQSDTLRTLSPIPRDPSWGVLAGRQDLPARMWLGGAAWPWQQVTGPCEYSRAGRELKSSAN